MINKSTHKKKIFDYEIDQNKFWANVAIGDEKECWLWTRACNTSGYGLFSVKNSPEEYERTGRVYSQVLAHRVAAALTHGLENHEYVMHKCDTVKCCNPHHLQVGNALDNLLDAINKGRHKGPVKTWVYGTLSKPILKNERKEQG